MSECDPKDNSGEDKDVEPSEEIREGDSENIWDDDEWYPDFKI